MEVITHLDIVSSILEQIIYGLMTGGIYAMIGVGLSMIFGVMRLSNFAHGEFYMLGAYLTYVLVSYMKFDPYVLAPLAAMFVGFVGIIINKILIKPLYEEIGRARGTAAFYFQDLRFILMTVGISIFLYDLALVVWKPIPIRVNTALSDMIIRVGPLSFGGQRIVTLIIAITSLITLYIFLKKTRIGKAIRALSQNPSAAMLVGVDAPKIYDITVFIALMLAGLAGGIVGPIFNLYPRMGLDVVPKAFVVVILGGIGNIIGSIYAGFFLGVVENLGGYFLGTEYREVIGFVLMILTLWLRPQGLLGIRR